MEFFVGWLVSELVGLFVIRLVICLVGCLVILW